eukprot:9354419-Lingulodinium_polyedra.AAC.1
MSWCMWVSCTFLLRHAVAARARCLGCGHGQQRGGHPPPHAHARSQPIQRFANANLGAYSSRHLVPDAPRGCVSRA